ncbi:phage antirepressor KilAC domain-containing protein [Niallia sp. 03190]|uniref:phage antirepressor KilAC domain-containing protein n=1 Tax=Niallia sp. 03190 TaxID=3458061 RepID=UPI004043C412
MNELITTNHNENGEIIVSGRELYEFLEVKTNYSTWFERMKEYGFIENIDFILLSNFEKQIGSGGHNKIDHHMKIDMAKEIAMIQRSEKGKQARQYFLQLEKMWNSPEMVMKRALEYADKKVIELKEKIDLDKPKVFFADAIQISENTILIKDLATLLKQKGYNTGQNRLFEWLRDNGYLCKSIAYYNKPTQRSMDLELFEVSTHIHSGSDGKPYTKYTPKVTGKGQIYFINKFLDKEKSPVRQH